MIWCRSRVGSVVRASAQTRERTMQCPQQDCEDSTFSKCGAGKLHELLEARRGSVCLAMPHGCVGGVADSTTYNSTIHLTCNICAHTGHSRKQACNEDDSLRGGGRGNTACTGKHHVPCTTVTGHADRHRHMRSLPAGVPASIRWAGVVEYVLSGGSNTRM
eukprot:TRINITY_DN10376_c0_g1_i4.p1 TRINITY_DN10376_c0_g1~~TRINITY_DN10376_c0_g1_i4.p1  ORF type:complete len:161 (-),score=7.57 TRINITY_DN10376_c0_g1_i4:76-558(-)